MQQQNNSYQFLHLETYALKPRKNTKRPSASSIARECQRADNSYPHISSPQPPELLYGITPLEALERVQKLVREC